MLGRNSMAITQSDQVHIAIPCAFQGEV
jgi:hypothetical protein